MSDEWGGQGEGSDTAVAEGPTAGALLRQAREASGLHVAALAVSLKVPVRKLEALEEDRYDLMGDNVFIRGLASSVCRSLKIDPQPVLERLPQTSAPRLVRDNEGINTPFRAPSDAAPPSLVKHLTQPVSLGVFALLVGAVVIMFVPFPARDEFSGPPTARTEAANPAQVQPALGAPTPVAQDPGPKLVPAASLSTPVPVSATPAAPAASPVPAPAPATATAAPGPAAAAGVVVFRAKGPSWVEVTDAKGVVALRKVLAPGEEAGASGALPLNVTVGRIDMTEVQVRGKPFDLGSVSRDNVARFQVK